VLAESLAMADSAFVMHGALLRLKVSVSVDLREAN
jgi:hypothetical protein